MAQCLSRQSLIRLVTITCQLMIRVITLFVQDEFSQHVAMSL